MPEPRPDPEAVGARDRLGAALRMAWAEAEEAPLEDETQRLMLHLSIEPFEPVEPRPAPGPGEPPRRRTLLRRLLG